MSSGNSRTVETNQDGINDALDGLVDKYLHTTNLKPIQKHTQDAFDKMNEWLAAFDGDIIFDSCCGVGLSTQQLAQHFSDARIIGIDKSDIRVGKHLHHSQDVDNKMDNYLILRADVIDFWRLAVQAGMQLSQHFLLYPNPYPKKTQDQKRWHGSASFLDLHQLGGQLEVRSNWLLYLQECQFVLKKLKRESEISVVNDPQPLTMFEKKYQASGQDCYRLVTR